MTVLLLLFQITDKEIKEERNQVTFPNVTEVNGKTRI